MAAEFLGKTAIQRMPTSWATSLARLVDYLAGRGIGRDALLSKLGVDPAKLQNPDARIPLRAYEHALEIGAETLADPYLGIRYIEDTGFGSIDAIGFLVMSSATIGESFRRFLEYLPLLSQGLDMGFEEHGQRVVFHCRHDLPPSSGQAHLTEIYAAGFLVMVPRVAGIPVPVNSLRFTHPARGDAEEFRRRLGAIPEFSAPVNEWSFPSSVLQLPMPNADAVLNAFFERYLSQRPRPQVAPVGSEVRAALGASLPDGDVSLSRVARRMGVGTRTLQRRLAEAGLSFEATLEEVRASRAKAYLEAQLPVADVTHLLGYADRAAFYRAFRRWTGMTPLEWRAKHSQS